LAYRCKKTFQKKKLKTLKNVKKNVTKIKKNVSKRRITNVDVFQPTNLPTQTKTQRLVASVDVSLYGK